MIVSHQCRDVGRAEPSSSRRGGTLASLGACTAGTSRLRAIRCKQLPRWELHVGRGDCPGHRSRAGSPGLCAEPREDPDAGLDLCSVFVRLLHAGAAPHHDGLADPGPDAAADGIRRAYHRGWRAARPSPPTHSSAIGGFVMKHAHYTASFVMTIAMLCLLLG